MEQRIQRLRSYHWSSYRSYIALEPAPEWLETGSVLRLGGRRKAEWAERYREYVESAAREGLEESPWEEVKEQAVLGGEDFLEEVRGQVAGDEREQRGARRLAGRRPGLVGSGVAGASC